MSGKDFDTKVPRDTNVDSGYLSGRLDNLDEVTDDKNVDSGYLSAPIASLDGGNLGASADNLGNVHNLVESDDLCTNLKNLDLKDFEKPTIELSSRRPKHTSSEGRLPRSAFFQQDDDGDTNLHIAAAQGCTKSIAILLKICPNKELLDLQNDYRHTALHLAVMGGFSLIAKMLVLGGASVHLRDVCGRTPVHYAAEMGNVDCLSALLAPVAEQPERNIQAILNQKDFNGQTCVHLAATAGHVKTLHTLVYYKADINAQEGLAGWTALHIAARRGDGRLAHYLLRECPGVDAAARDFGRRTPRRLARRGPLAHMFDHLEDDSDSSEDEDDESEEAEAFYEKLLSNQNLINVA